MSNRRKRLNKKQIAVLDDMFSGDLDEQTVFDKHKVSRNIYNNWLGDETFTDEFNRRIRFAHLQSQVLIARYAPLAAMKLVQLTESEKEETARKACLDIIKLPKPSAEKGDELCQSSSAETVGQELSKKTVSRLLSALAEDAEN